MSTTIQPEDLKLDRSRFPYSLKWKKKEIATIYSSTLVEPLKTIVASTAIINRLILEKTRLLDFIYLNTGDIADIDHEKSLSFSIGDEGSVVLDNVSSNHKIDIGSKWTSKKGDPYKVISIDSKRGIAIVSWLKGSYTREVKLEILLKNYKPMSGLIINNSCPKLLSEFEELGGPDVDDDD